MEYRDTDCPFDFAPLIGSPDCAPGRKVLDVPAIIRRLDELYAREDYPGAQALLKREKQQARLNDDWRSCLSLVSEELGLYRRTLQEKQAMDAVEEARSLIEEHRMGRTVSGATVLLNAATTLKCFGRIRESADLFRHVSAVYADNLDSRDYRFAGLYNNMALTLVDLEEYPQAERYFRLALKVLSRCENSLCDQAATWCNLAECYERQNDEDSRIAECMEEAGSCLLSPEAAPDGYFSFTAKKCLPVFDRTGFFWYAGQIRKKLEETDGVS